MAGVLTVAGTAVAPGTRVRAAIEVRGCGYAVRMPVTMINGRGDGPVAAVIAGLHGAEYPCIETTIRLARRLDPHQVRGALIIVHVVNEPAFYGRTAYVNPLDGLNPNRVFPGSATGSISERMVRRVWEDVIAPADYLIDLHGGDIVEALVPFAAYTPSGNAAVDDVARRMAWAYGIPRVLEAEIPGSSMWAAARAGKPAVLAEAGGGGLLDEPSVATLLEGTERALAVAGVLPAAGVPSVSIGTPTKMIWHRAAHQGMFYPSIKVGDRVERGQVLGRICDVYGDVLTEVRSEASGDIIFLVTCPPVSPGDPLLAVGGT